MMKLAGLIVIFLFQSVQFAKAQTNDFLQQEIQNLISKKNAIVGLAVSGNMGESKILINGDKAFPMQSVFKLPIAFYVLSEIDKKKFSLVQPIEITKNDLLPETWSPIREKFPDGTTMPLSDLIKYTVSESDNNGCDILLRLVGGPERVEAYLHSVGIKDISIKFNEEQMHADWNHQFENWITPEAADQMLRLFFYNKEALLSPESHHFIWKIMKETQTGPDKLKGKLPKGTLVAHKTGSSGTNDDGLIAAENDIGIVFRPDGTHFFISIFVSKSTETAEKTKEIIADISKLCWDYLK